MTTVLTVEDTPPSLEAAQQIVGGYVTIVRLDDGSQMLVDEEGLLKGSPVNPIASAMAGQTIVGNVLVLKGTARWT